MSFIFYVIRYPRTIVSTYGTIIDVNIISLKVIDLLTVLKEYIYI